MALRRRGETDKKKPCERGPTAETTIPSKVVSRACREEREMCAIGAYS